MAPNFSSNNTILVNSSISTTTPTQQILTTQSSPITSVGQMPGLTQTQQVQQHQQHQQQQQMQSNHQNHQQNSTTMVVQHQQQQQQQQQLQQQQLQQNLNSGSITTGSGNSVVVTQQQPNAQRSDNAKEKCRKFLTNLIELSKREPAQVELNVKTLIQELVDANVGPEDFCKKLENLLNAAPQPCLIGFLKRSLPLLRQSLVTKEIVIEGINPPSPSVAFSGATITTTQIPVSYFHNYINDCIINLVLFYFRHKFVQ